MTTILLIFLLAFGISALCTRLSIPLAIKLDLVDRPDGYRKTHARPTPRFGGPAIFVAFFVPLIIMLVFSHRTKVADVITEKPRDILGIFIGAGLALMLGTLDDRFDLRARWKLLWQIIIGIAMCTFGFTIQGISNPFGGTIMLGIFAYPITVFWVVACMNAVNLADGMDGLAAGICLFVSLTLFFLSLQLENVLGLLLMGCLSGSILGFLLFNFPPARIFLGDSGSMLLGFLIASLSLVAGRKAEAAVALFIPVVALGLPVIDTGLAIIRRWYHKLPMSSPDREHIHHVLVSMGLSQRRAVLTLYSMCLLLGMVALVLTVGRSEIVLVVMVLLCTMIYAALRIFAGIRFRDILAQISRNRVAHQRSLDAAAAVQRAILGIRAAPTTEDLWNECSRVFEAFGFTCATLQLRAQKRALGWSRTMETKPVPAPLLANAAQETQEIQTDNITCVEKGSSQIPDEAQCHDVWSSRLALTQGNRAIGEFMIESRTQSTQLPVCAPELINRLRRELEARIAQVAGNMVDCDKEAIH